MTNNECHAQEPRYCWKHGTSIKPSSYLPKYEETARARDELQSLVMTSPSAKTRREAEKKIETLAVSIDASEEGYVQLGQLLKSASRDGDRVTGMIAEYRLQKADALRAKLLAGEAVASWLDDNPHNLERLFDGTGHQAARLDNGDILISKAEGAAPIRIAAGEHQRANLFDYRNRVADWQQYVEVYSSQQAARDLPEGYSVQPLQTNDDRDLLVRDKQGRALVRVQLNEDRSFANARINAPHNDGSLASVPSLFALRATLFKLDQQNNGPLPAWASGDPEPGRQAVAATTANPTGDQLF